MNLFLDLNYSFGINIQMGKKQKRTAAEREISLQNLSLDYETEYQEQPNKSKFLKKKPWSDEEDNLVRKLVERYGAQRWSFIAKFVPGRLGKQCRQRWHNHLNPNILKAEWASYEEWILFLAHTALGNKWADMTRMIPGRTDNSIKNHWNSTMKKKISEFMSILENLLIQNKTNYLEKKHVADHEYLQTQKELLTKLLKDKENIIKSKEGNEEIKVPRLQREKHESTLKRRPFLSISKDTHKIQIEELTSQLKPRVLASGSIRKTDKQMRENLGNLIFETPPKAKQSQVYASSQNLEHRDTPSPFSRIIIQEQPQQARQLTHVKFLQSPSQFMLL